jgi:hypothetical protein
VAFVEPAPLVDGLQEPPDVFDVRVREGVVVVVPVHPHAEPARLLGDHVAVLRHPLLAAFGKLGQAVRLDVALRVQAERLLDLHFNPKPLAVEPVLIALVEAAHRLVALKDVLERPAPGVVYAHRVVGGDRSVDEAPARAAAILLAEALERPLSVPTCELGALESRMVGDRRKRRERA